MSASYTELLDVLGDVRLKVEFLTEGRDMVDYSLAVIVMRHGTPSTVRVYDGAHGVNEMHRYTRSGGKQRAIRFHRGTLGEGMRAARAEIKRTYPKMVEGWER